MSQSTITREVTKVRILTGLIVPEVDKRIGSTRHVASSPDTGGILNSAFPNDCFKADRTTNGGTQGAVIREGSGSSGDEQFVSEKTKG
ncbi:unnamed protein product [Nezara viridula]|uniref:Uncharacterized protein n=1 Tax=Nezara viridula TaxID=85310 RepID=A0A9P0H7S9_NEZVI|nr:unnamed protein product [Nezara viridula]